MPSRNISSVLLSCLMSFYIASDAGDDATFLQQMIWAAGGQPFKVDGDPITINLTNNPEVKKVVDYWQRMLDEGLIDTHAKAWQDNLVAYGKDQGCKVNE